MEKSKPPEHEAPTGANQGGAEREALTDLARTLNSLLSLPECNGNGKGELFTGIPGIAVNGKQPKNTGDIYKTKIREQWLRQELQANRTLMLGMMQWGVMTLAAIETALYYVRRDVANNLFMHGVLPTNGTVPPARWFVGTMFVLMVASMFCAMSKYLATRHVGYRKQLLDMEPSFSEIAEMATGGKANRLPHFLYLAFPAVDFLLWFYFHLTSTISIPW